MNSLAGMLSDPTVIRLAMVLLHFLWQGCLFALAAIVTLGALRNAMPQLRYLVLLGLFVLMAASPIVTFHALPTHVSLGELEPTVVRVADGGRRFDTSNAEEQATHEPSKTSSAVTEDVPHQTELTPMPIGGETTDKAVMPPGDTRFELLTTGDLSWGSWLVVAWSVGVVLLSMRLLYGLLAAERLKRRGVQPIEQALQKTARRIQRQLAIWREVPVMVSQYVNVPTLVGYFKPVILMPTSAMLGLTPQQFEAILAHELSHVARHDYLTNVLQCVVETLLFYHPAVWWMSRRLRHERELCCDDMATAICDDRRVYAEAIYFVAQARNDSAVPALAATGSPLVQRIKRLAERDTKKTNQSSGWLAALVMIIAVSLLGLGLQATVAATEESASRMELHTPGGVVDIEMFDSRVEIGFDSETGLLNITGAGPNEIKIKLGPQQFPMGGGEPDNWLTITRGEKPVVRFRLRTVFNVNDLGLIHSFNEGASAYSGALSPDGTRALIGGDIPRPYMLLWDTEGGEVIKKIPTSIPPLFVAYSPNGRQVAAASINGMAQLLDLESGELLREFPHRGMITSIEFSPDGKRLATGGVDNTVCIWNVADGSELLRYREHENWVTCLAFTPDGKQIASGSADATVHVWYTDTGNTMSVLKHPEPVWSVAVSGDGQRIASGTGGPMIGPAAAMNVKQSDVNDIFVWDANTGEQLLRLAGHKHSVKGIDITSDGRYAVSGSLDSTLRLWDLTEGVELRKFSYEGWVTSVHFSPDNWQVLATGGIRYEAGRAIQYPEERVRLFQLTKTESSVEAADQEQSNYTYVFDAGGDKRRDAIASDDAEKMVGDFVLRSHLGIDEARVKVKELTVAAKIYPLDLELRKRLEKARQELAVIESFLRESNPSLPQHPGVLHQIAALEKGGAVPSLAYLPDGIHAIAGGDQEYERLLLWNTQTNTAEHYFTVDTSCFTVAASPDGALIANAGLGSDGTIMLWDLESREIVCELQHGSSVMCLAFSPDGRRLISGGTDATACVWDVEEEKELLRFRGHQRWIADVVVSPDGKAVLTGSGDHTARVWDIDTGAELHSVSHPAPVWSVAVAPDSRYFATGTGGGPRESLSPLTFKPSDEKSIRYWQHADGRTYIVRSSKDNQIRCWGMGGGRLVRTLSGHSDLVKSLVFTPDTKRLVSGSFDGTLRVWNLQDGKEIDRVQSQTWVTSVAISPNGHRVISGGGVSKNDAGELQHRRDEQLQLYLLD